MKWNVGETPGPAWLFCPADRPERYAKAAAVADVVILDLEDGVAPRDRATARHALINTPLNPERTIVRINPTGTEAQKLDLLALAETQYTRVMLPKCQSAEQITALAPRQVIALVESALGALNVASVAQMPGTIGVMWGAEDLVAGLGGKSSRRSDGSYRDVAVHVRSCVLLAAKAYGRFALDSVYLDIRDSDGLRQEAKDAAAIGFDAKVAIHPTQVDVIRRAYAPSEAEIDWAQKVVSQVPTQRGVFAFEGKMVDAPLLRHAEAILQQSGLPADRWVRPGGFQSEG